MSVESLRRDAARQREWRSRNLEEARRRTRLNTKKIRKWRQEYIDAFKLERGCVDCGYKDHAAALEFDHIDPEQKAFGIAAGLTLAWERVLAEIEKCEVRCANCHAVRTFTEGHQRRRKVLDTFERVG